VGVTLVEVLTQRLPAWEFKGQEEPELPRMPAPFGDIAKQCLRRDPQARCTLAEIATRLDPDAPPLGRVQAAVKPAAVAAPVEPVRAAAPVPVPVPAAIPPKPVARREVAPARVPAPAPAAEAKPVAEKPRAAATAAVPKRGYAVPAIAIAAVALVAIVFAPKLLRRNQEMSPDLTASAASDQPATAPVPGASAVTAEATKPEPAAVPSPAVKPAAARKKIVLAAGGVGGGVVHQVLPDVPQKALETIQGTVRTGVRVTVDASGKVVDADLESAGPSRYFSNLAQQAARSWTFTPPTANGEPVPSAWLVRFEFSPDGAKATATQASR
jgi:TonB family protein